MSKPEHISTILKGLIAGCFMPTPTMPPGRWYFRAHPSRPWIEVRPSTAHALQASGMFEGESLARREPSIEELEIQEMP